MISQSEIDAVREENIRLKSALHEIDAKVCWEINPSNYTHQEVCDMNADFCEVGNIANVIINKEVKP